jgi:hypothetical protein
VVRIRLRAVLGCLLTRVGRARQLKRVPFAVLEQSEMQVASNIPTPSTRIILSRGFMANSPSAGLM